MVWKSIYPLKFKAYLYIVASVSLKLKRKQYISNGSLQKYSSYLVQSASNVVVLQFDLVVLQAHKIYAGVQEAAEAHDETQRTSFL